MLDEADRGKGNWGVDKSVGDGARERTRTAKPALVNFRVIRVKNLTITEALPGPR